MQAAMPQHPEARHPVTETFPASPRWPGSPLIHEIDTLPWLRDVSERHAVASDLAALPEEAWDEIALPGVDAVWFMGAWERSDAGLAVAKGDPRVMDEIRSALPDATDEDLVGSAYCVRSYTIDRRLGGDAGLAAARSALARRGVRIILDFVSNHVGIDHAWCRERPELLVQGTAALKAERPFDFHEIGGTTFAHGRDPHFYPWRDTLQVNAFAPGARAAAIEQLRAIAALCDGVRCDMAMLLLSEVFAGTWGELAGERPAGEFWADVIAAVRETNPGFVFIAEAYWDTQAALNGLGFNFCYDKRFYDRLREGSAQRIRDHLAAPYEHQSRLLRFIENHDEERAPLAFGPGRERAAAVAGLTVPGARMLFEGQAAGRTVRLPVFLVRRPHEERDTGLQEFYSRLLPAVSHPAIGRGTWEQLPTRGWPDNRSNEHLLTWKWENGEYRLLVVVNYSGASAQGRVAFPWPGVSNAQRQLHDLLSGETYWRSTAELDEEGLFVDLPPWGAHVLDCTGISRPLE
jgi:hypothetical protein